MKGKGKKKEKESEEDGVDGVVYKVCWGVVADDRSRRTRSWLRCGRARTSSCQND